MLKPFNQYPKEKQNDPKFKEQYKRMLKRVRCVWCGGEWYVGDLDTDEHNKPSYCPACRHKEFDDRPWASFVSATFLQSTWNRKINCEDCEWEGV